MVKRWLTGLIIGLVLWVSWMPVAHAQELKIATWNIAHLNERDNQGSNPRTVADYDRLKNYANQLDADVVALQEIQSEKAAARVFDPSSYDIYLEDSARPGSKKNTQRTGFAVRKGYTVQHNPDYTDLDITNTLRYGTDITVSDSGKSLRLMSVHLKASCPQNLLSHPSRDCATLNQQVKPLEDWIDARANDSTPFVVLGDFNRRFNLPGEEIYAEIDDGIPANADLTNATAGSKPQCWSGQYKEFIDHILLDKQASASLKPGSFEELVYTEPVTLKEELSDHCPLAVTLDF